MCDHIMILLPAIFESTGLDAYTFGALPHECSELVLRAWWAVNGAYQVSHIFGRLAETRVALRFVARR